MHITLAANGKIEEEGAWYFLQLDKAVENIRGGNKRGEVFILYLLVRRITKADMTMCLPKQSKHGVFFLLSTSGEVMQERLYHEALIVI